MKGADNIKNAILSDAEENAVKIAEESGKKVESILAEAYAQAEAFMNEQIKLIESEGNEIVEKANTEGRLSVRRAVLSYKQELLKEVFARTLAHFEALDGEAFVNTVVSVIKNNAEGGEVVLSEENLPKYGESIIARLGEGFTLCEKGENIGAGAVIRQGRIEINCRFAAIVERLMDTEAQKVSDILFGG